MTKVLFICTGNTCRSPMAEAFFNKIAKDEKIDAVSESAGLFVPEKMQPASENAIAVAAEYGLDITGHRASEVTPEQIENADIIFGMTGMHASAMKAALGHLQKDIRKIAEKDISDPYGGDIEVYRAAAEEILEAVKNILKELKQ